MILDKYILLTIIVFSYIDINIHICLLFCTGAGEKEALPLTYPVTKQKEAHEATGAKIIYTPLVL